MFDNARYATSGLSKSISKPVQQLLWDMIDKMEVDKKDYLQVFKLEIEISKDNLPLLKITHTQEAPEYEKIHYYKCEKPIKATVFVIDNETHSTMLLSSDY